MDTFVLPKKKEETFKPQYLYIEDFIPLLDEEEYDDEIDEELFVVIIDIL